MAGGTLLKTVDTTFDGSANSGWSGGSKNVVARFVKTTWPSGKVSEIQKDYDPGVVGFTFGNVVEERVYDFGNDTPGALLVKTKTKYLALEATGTAYKNANMVDLVSQVDVCGPADACDDDPDHVRSRTKFNYDESALTAFTPTPSTLNTSPPGPRGNQTTISRWSSKRTPAAFLTTTNTYFNTGMVKSTQDPLLHTTNFSYSSTFHGAYLTQTSNALTQTTSASYDFSTGLLLSSTDVNNVVTLFPIYDSALRLRRKILADQTPATAQIDYEYTDTVPPKIRVTVPVAGTTTIESEAHVDQLGRTRLTKLLTDPDGTVFTRTSYDNLGRALQTWNASRCNLDTNPTSCAGENTFGITTNVYDGLGRLTKLIPPDGNADFNNVTTDFSDYPTVTVKDQQGRQLRSTSDALGRLVKVEEPGGTSAPTQGAVSLTVSGTYQWTVTGGQSATAGAGSVAISGATQSTWVDSDVCNPECQTIEVWDSGKVGIRVNNVLKEVNYSRFVNNTATLVASALATAIHNDASYPADAQANGASVTLWARTTGASTNYSLTASATTNNPGTFPGGSYTVSPSGSAFTGGQNAVLGNPICDSGSVWVTVAAFSAATTYNGTWNGSSCTTTSSATGVANALRDVFNNNLNSPVTAVVTPNGSNATLTLTSKLTGAVGNYSFSTGKSTNFPANFASASYGASPIGTSLSGGADGATLSTPAKTFYTYDALGNLTKVEQWGTEASCDPNPPNGKCRVRTFEYDSLSQLTKAINPESGTIEYKYDDDGNLKEKKSPAPNQLPPSTATQIITYCYDALHRLTSKFCSASSCVGTPDVTYTFDQGTNGKGRRTGMSDASGSTTWIYDELGRVLSEERTIGTVSKTFQYSYNKDGSLKELTYPSARKVTYTTSAAGRTVSAVDITNSVNYVTNAKYSPAGSLCSMVNGSITSTFTYNNRLQPERIHATTTGAPATPCNTPTGTGTILDLAYGFNWGNANNGNVLFINNNRASTRSQKFSYDDLNRIKTAETNSNQWGNSYVYDAWGNLLQKNLIEGKLQGESLQVNANAKNQMNATTQVMDSYCYDLAGNLVKQAACPLDPLAVDYTYDPENRLKTAGGETYTYDGDGKRVKKSSGKLYWGSGPFMKSDLNGTTLEEYVFFNGKRLARQEPPPTQGTSPVVHFYFSDHLGSASVTTGAAGSVEQESDYYPFGGERVVTAGPNTFKFTGKERDSESGLDYFGARHYGNPFGRFVQADAPFADQDSDDPQSWNLYTYVRNNPLQYIDPNGRGAVAIVIKLAAKAGRQKLIKNARVRAVRNAWKQERAMVLKTGKGTRKWTPAEKKELLETGQVKGYFGHHIKSVKGNEHNLKLIADPNNIQWKKGLPNHLDAHGGNFHNPTTGELLDRGFSASMLTFMLTYDDVVRDIAAEAPELTADPDSIWSYFNPFNNAAESAALYAAFALTAAEGEDQKTDSGKDNKMEYSVCDCDIDLDRWFQSFGSDR